MIRQFVICSLAILLTSCQQSDHQIIVGWKTLGLPFEERVEDHPSVIDTIGVTPYNTSTIKFHLKIDSLFKSNTIELLGFDQDFVLDGYDIFVGRLASFNHMGKLSEYSMIDIYRDDMLWNVGYIYNPEFGIVAEYPGHSSKQLLLDFIIEGNDTVYKLDDRLLSFLQYDRILHPIPPMPETPPVIIEVPQE